VKFSTRHRSLSGSKPRVTGRIDNRPPRDRSNAQHHQAEYLRSVALRIKAGPSNPQQGFVGTDRAKVQTYGTNFWWFWNRAGAAPRHISPQGGP
jgi:hypothetical protein